MEQELTSGLRERQVSEFVEDDEVEACKVISHPTLLSVACFRFQAIDQIDDIVEAPTRPVTDKRTGNCNGQMALARSRAADKNDVALVGNEGAGGQFSDQGFINGRVCKIEVVNVLCQRQFGDGELVANGACLFLGDLRLQEVPDNMRRFVLPFDPIAHDLVVGAAHSVELQRAHQFKNLRAFHQLTLLSLS
ncbi:hypothetical protein D3C72_1830030 [compost metagenome]